MSEIRILYEGYSDLIGEDEMIANCSCTLIKGEHNIIVDTMTAWDSENILCALQKNNLAPDQINYVISTHGHSDHVGNNNLFLNAKHIVGFSLSFKNKYYFHPFHKGQEYIINDTVKVVPTPGHTLSDITVVVTTIEDETVAVTGDLFEKHEDIENACVWLNAGSEDPVLQMKNRSKIAELAHWIIPGHGPKFQVTPEIRESLSKQTAEASNT